MQIISTICAYIERSKKHPLENVVQQEHFIKADCLNGYFENARVKNSSQDCVLKQAFIASDQVQCSR